jgi:hypothetical protein
MSTTPGDRLLALLPALFRQADDSGDLQRFLSAFEALFLRQDEGLEEGLPALEQQIVLLPTLFAPAGGHHCGDGPAYSTPTGFVHWLARWLGFVPHYLFNEVDLRRIIAGLVPLYGWRGTHRYLEDLLRLCFGSRLARIDIDDRPGVGLVLGRSRIALDTRLTTSRPHWFILSLQGVDADQPDPALARQVRAVVDFAKPAHTRCEIKWLGGSSHQPAGGKAP